MVSQEGGGGGQSSGKKLPIQDISVDLCILETKNEEFFIIKTIMGNYGHKLSLSLFWIKYIFYEFFFLFFLFFFFFFFFFFSYDNSLSI